MRKRFFQWILWGAYWQLIARQKASDVKTEIMHTKFGRWCVRVILVAALAGLAYLVYSEIERDLIESDIENHSHITADPNDSI